MGKSAGILNMLRWAYPHRLATSIASPFGSLPLTTVLGSGEWRFLKYEGVLRVGAADIHVDATLDSKLRFSENFGPRLDEEQVETIAAVSNLQDQVEAWLDALGVRYKRRKVHIAQLSFSRHQDSRYGEFRVQLMDGAKATSSFKVREKKVSWVDTLGQHQPRPTLIVNPKERFFWSDIVRESLDGDDESHAERLLSLAKKKDLDAIRAMGEELNQAGGFDRMLLILLRTERIAVTSAICDHGVLDTQSRTWFADLVAQGKGPSSFTFFIGPQALDTNSRCVVEAQSLKHVVDDTWHGIGSWLA